MNVEEKIAAIEERVESIKNKVIKRGSIDGNRESEIFTKTMRAKRPTYDGKTPWSTYRKQLLMDGQKETKLLVWWLLLETMFEYSPGNSRQRPENICCLVSRFEIRFGDKPPHHVYHSRLLSRRQKRDRPCTNSRGHRAPGPHRFSFSPKRIY